MRSGNGGILAAVLALTAGAGAVTLRLVSFDAVGRSQLRAAESRLALAVDRAAPPAEPILADHDGAASFRSALDRMRLPGDLDLRSELNRARRGEPFEEPQRIAGALPANREAMADLHAAAVAPGLVFDWDVAPGEEWALEELVRDAANLLELAGWRAAQAGDWREAIRMARTLGRLSQGFFTEEVWSPGLALERSGLNLLRAVAAQPGIPAGVLGEAARSLAPRPRDDDELLGAQAARTRRVLAMAGVEVRRIGLLDRLAAWRLESLFRHWTAGMLSQYADQIELAREPLPEWREEIYRRREQRIERGLADRVDNAFEGKLLRIAHSNRELARLALDLRILAAEAGRYPERLPADAPEIDPLGGQPLRYVLRDDGGAELSAPSAITAIEGSFGYNHESWTRLSIWRLGAPGGGVSPPG